MKTRKRCEGRKGTGSGLWLGIGLSLALLAGCGERREEAEVRDRGWERVAERGPHEVVLRLDRAHPTVADRVTLTLEARVAEDWKVIWPVIKEKLGEKPQEFQVVDQGALQPELLRDGRTRKARTYVLEPFLSGTYRIPGLEFRFEKEGREPLRLETEAVSVEVRSLLAEGAGGKLHDIAAPVGLSQDWGRAWAWGLGLLALAGGAAAGWWWWRKRLRAEAAAAEAPRRPAHEIAFEELDALLTQDLPGKGRIKPYYQELSAILRRYVENRFGVHAPGQTTEEFLVYQSRSGILEKRHQLLLKEFLQYCDLVKFAEMQAGPEQACQAFDACRGFVQETRLMEEEPAGAEAARTA